MRRPLLPRALSVGRAKAETDAIVTPQNVIAPSEALDRLMKGMLATWPMSRPRGTSVQGHLRAHHQALPQLGLGAGKRPRRRRARGLFIDEHAGQRRMGVRRAARHPADLRGRGARLSRLAGTYGLKPEPPASQARLENGDI